MSHGVRAGRAGTIAFLLALYLSPLTVYLGLYRSIPSPQDAAGAGAGLEDCGYLLGEHRSPDADPASRRLCEPPRRDAAVLFSLVATVNGGLLVAAAGYGARAFLTGRADSAG